MVIIQSSSNKANIPPPSPLLRDKQHGVLVFICLLIMLPLLAIFHQLYVLTTTPTYPLSVKRARNENSHILKTCQLRDLSNYSTSKVGRLYQTLVPKTLEASNCLFFDCDKDVAKCDNTNTTNFDGPKPPCCTHILRDMSRIFDEAMCSLGLDYVVAFGTLLGFRRKGRIIPWTADNDYIIPSMDVANAFVQLWDSNKTGMAHHFQGINRMCVTPNFADGELQKWARVKPVNQTLLWSSGLPYIDFYLGRNVTERNYQILLRSSEVSHAKKRALRNINGTIFGTFGQCLHLYSDIFPTKRELVHNGTGTFAQNFPANTDQLLRTFYGRNWKIPLSGNNVHGHISCPYGPTE